METYNFPHVVPHLVEDNSLKRARTTVIEGGQEKEAIQVTPVGAPTVDAQTIADGMGKAPTSTASNSVCDRLEVLGTKSDAAVSGTQSGSINGRIRNLELTSASIYQYLINIANYIGSFTSAAWSGTGDGTLNEVDKRTSNDAHAAAEVLGTTSDASVSTDYNGTISGRIKHISGSAYNTRIKTEVIATSFGSTTASPWSGSGGATLIAINKRTSNDTNATALATGTQSDAAWSGTGDGSVIALLKGIYNKL